MAEGFHAINSNTGFGKIIIQHSSCFPGVFFPIKRENSSIFDNIRQTLITYNIIFIVTLYCCCIHPTERTFDHPPSLYVSASVEPILTPLFLGGATGGGSLAAFAARGVRGPGEITGFGGIAGF